MAKRGKSRAMAGVALAACVAAAMPAYGVDLPDVQPAALDQPHINAIVYIGNNTQPQIYDASIFGGLGDIFGDIFGDIDLTTRAVNITPYLDTGASGILISASTANLLSVPQQTVNGQAILFYDVGVAGADQFAVSQPIRMSLAHYFPRTDLDLFSDVAQTLPIVTAYTPIPIAPGEALRAQVGPVDLSVANPVTDDLSEFLALYSALDVIGMPAMKGKVVVMNPTPVNLAGAIFNGTFDLDTLDELPDFSMRTYLYDPGTPFRPNTPVIDPGIPQVDLRVKLSYGSFDEFTQVTPGGTGPTLERNPFIGKDPVAVFKGTPTPEVPGIKISPNSAQGLKTSEGSWLLDTGAAASIISTTQALGVGVKYLAGTEPGNIDGNAPVLVDAFSNIPLAEQFSLTIGGIGGQTTISGFFLDSMLLRTMEGNAANDNDPLHLRFVHAPVLVSDIKLRDPVSDQVMTLDGIFGMNYLVASASFSGGDLIPTIDLFATGFFDWITFDETTGILGLSIDPASGIVLVPEPASLSLIGAGVLLLTLRRRRASL